MSATSATLAKDDAARPWKDLAVLLTTNVIIAGFAYVSNVGLANRMGPTLFGEYSYILIVGTFLNQFILFGSEQFMIRTHMVHGDHGIARIFRARLYNLGLAVAGVVIWAVVTREWMLFYSLIFAVQSLSLPSVFEAHKQNRVFALLYLGERALYLAWLWLGIAALGVVNLHWVLGSLALWSTLSVAWQLYTKRECLRTPVRGAMGGVWAAGIGLMIFDLSKYMYSGGTRLFIKEDLGFKTLGIFSAVWQFVPLGTMYLSQITKSWRLRITESVHRGNLPEFKRLLRQMLTIVLGPMALGCFLLLFGGADILNAVFSKDYSGAAHLFPWLAAYMVVVAFDSINSMMWVALGQVRAFTTLFCIFGGLCTLLNILGKGKLQLEGYFSIVILCHGLAVFTSLALLAPRLRRNFAKPV